MTKLMVWITADSKDGMRDKLIKILDEPFGNTFTANQNGCERLERSLDNQNHNRLFLTELWSSKEDWDTYFENGTKVRDENGFNKRLGELLKEGDIVIYESTVYPGATEEVCVPILENVSKLVFNNDFFVGYKKSRYSFRETF